MFLAGGGARWSAAAVETGAFPEFLPAPGPSRSRAPSLLIIDPLRAPLDKRFPQAVVLFPGGDKASAHCPLL